MIVPTTAVSPQSSSASAVPNETAAAPDSGGGGFLEALMGLLGGPETATETVAGEAATLDLLLDVTEATALPSAEVPLVVATPTLVVAAVLQPAEIRAAQLMAHSGGAESTGQGAGPPSTMSPMMAAAPDGAALPPIDAALLSTPPEGTPASSMGLPQTLAQEGATPARLVSAETPVPRQLQAQVGTQAWADELGARLHLMADKGHQTASLRLSPEHLGPLEVQISVKEDKATVWFGTANGDTRAALEQAMPRLRELFAAQGMSLDQSGVFQNPRQDAGHLQRPPQDIDASNVDEAGLAPAVVIRRGLVDAYA